MTKFLKVWITIFGAALFLFSCTENQSDLAKVKLKTLDGAVIDMNDYKNKTVFINFWATWCKPCIQEMPTIVKAMEQLKDEDVVFLFPSNESVDLIKGFKERKKFNFNYVQAQNMEALNIIALPTTSIYNKKGTLIFSEAGFRDWSKPENLSLITNKTTNHE